MVRNGSNCSQSNRHLEHLTTQRSSSEVPERGVLGEENSLGRGGVHREEKEGKRQRKNIKSEGMLWLRDSWTSSLEILRHSNYVESWRTSSLGEFLRETQSFWSFLEHFGDFERS